MKSEFDHDETRSAIRREALSFLAHGVLLPFGLRRPRPPAPARSREQRIVMFVHGLGANRAGFLPLQAYLRLHGHRRQLAFNYKSAGSIERQAA